MLLVFASQDVTPSFCFGRYLTPTHWLSPEEFLKSCGSEVEGSQKDESLTWEGEDDSGG